MSDICAIVFFLVQNLSRCFLIKSTPLCVTNGPIVMPCLCCFFSLCIFLTTESFGKCFCFEAHTLTAHISTHCSLMLLLLLLLLLTFYNVQVLLKCMACILLTVTHVKKKNIYTHKRHTLEMYSCTSLQVLTHKLTIGNTVCTRTHMYSVAVALAGLTLTCAPAAFPHPNDYNNFLLTLTYLLSH